MFWLIASVGVDCEEFAGPSQVVNLEPVPAACCRNLAGSVEEFKIAAVTSRESAGRNYSPTKYYQTQRF